MRFHYQTTQWRAVLVRRGAWILIGLLAWFLPSAPARAAAPARDENTSPARVAIRTLSVPEISPVRDQAPLVQIIGDPVEPMNRLFFYFDNDVLSYVIDPLEHGYRFILPEPARQSIKKAGYNIAYPVRLINTLLQGKLTGAGVETGRFLLNTTVGVVGLFDPATKLGMKNYDEDFGKTFAYYGAGQGCYIYLPSFLVGSSNVRDLIGHPLDSLANPASWVYADTVFDFNELSLNLSTVERLLDSERDPYLLSREFWALARQESIRESKTRPGQPVFEPARTQAVPTLAAIKLKAKDPNFYDQADDRDVRIAATGKKLTYNYWLQKKPAPLVFILAGVGSNRLSDIDLAIAEMVYTHGYSAVTISSPTNWEFIEQAASVSVPGFTPVDARDLSGALESIALDLNKKYPRRITSTALMGLSLGALEALFIADLERQNPTREPHLDRTVAIDPPVDLTYALNQIDAYYDAALDWPAPERQAHELLALHKASKLIKEGIKNDSKLSFDETESKYLVGVNYRFILRNLLFASQKKKNQGVVNANFGHFNIQETYDKLAKYSYADYFRLFVMPYYDARREAGVTREAFVRRADLAAIEPTLRADQRLRVYVNQNDFILRPGDIDWLRADLGDRLKVFKDGGHLGNLYLPEVQDEILRSLADLKR